MSLKALLATARPGGTLRIPTGRYHEQLILSGCRDLHIEASGVILDGSGAPHGKSGLRLVKCVRITIEGLTVTEWRQKKDAGGHGCFATDSTDLKFIDLHSRSNEGSGLLTGGCSDVLVRGGEFNDNDGHGLYFSNGGSDIRVEGVTANTNERVGCHINGSPKRITLVRVKDCAFNRNGNVPVQFAAVTNGKVSNCWGTGNKRPNPVYWNDGRGEKYACRQCSEEDNAFA